MSQGRTIRCVLYGILLAVVYERAGQAQVVRDGSIGPDASVQAQGPVFEIPDSMGEQAGRNLFHSFSSFSVFEGERVVFQAGGNVDNIVARVTGGLLSFVNGGLTAPANLFLANPQGFLFGPGADLNVSGSFYVTTADYVEFGQNARFYTSLAPGSVLSVADPRQFGFLSDGPGRISSNGAFLSAPRISVIGGGIALFDSVIESRAMPLRGVDLVSVASHGTVRLPQGSELVATSPEVTRFGAIDLVSTDVRSQGPVVIRGGALLATGSSLMRSGSRVDVEVDRLDLSDQANIISTADIAISARTAITIVDSTPVGLTPGIFALTDGATPARRSVQLFTPTLTIAGGSLRTTTAGEGNGAHVLIDVGDFRLVGGGAVTTGPSDSETNRTGAGGDIVIRASGLVEVSGWSEGAPSHIVTGSSTSGNSGDIQIEAARVWLADGGFISSGAPSGVGATGSAGNIEIRARESVEIMGPSGLTGISASTFTDVDGGSIRISAPRVALRDQAVIASGTTSSGNGGQVHIQAGMLSMTNLSTVESAAGSGASGDGGSVEVEAERVELSNSLITTSSLGAGNAGDITFTAGDVALRDGGIIITHTGSGSTGNAGNVTIRSDRLHLDGLSAINTQSEAGAGGDIRLEVTRWIEAIGSTISTSVLGGAGGGGDITIRMGGEPDVAVMILDRSRLLAQADRGPGGNMRIVTDLFVPSAPPQTVVDASSQFGIDGEVQIDAPDASIVGTLATLPAAFLDAVGLIREGCIARAPESTSTFLVRGRGGLPAAPGGLLPGAPADGSQASAAGRPAYAGTLVGTTGDGRPVLLTVKC